MALTPRRRPLTLRREIIVTLLLKLAVLLLIKHFFFPARLPAEAASQGVAERLAQPEPATPARQNLSTKKDST